MTVTGIIAEYNPFHNGHAYHLETARQLTKADFIVVVMSGNFVQRGTPALLNKFLRAKMALLNGADLVLELPCAFATGSAEFFSEGAISILHELSVINNLCFGAETPNIKLLSTIADLLLNETPLFKETLSKALSKGATYPQARSEALLHCLSDDNEKNAYESLLQSPNNILGIEYLKSLKRRNSTITPYAISRIHSGYHDNTLSATGICSATAIRKALQNPSSSFSELQSQMPPSSFAILKEESKRRGFLSEYDLSLPLQYRLFETKDYTNYLDVGKELANRLLKTALPSMSFSELTQALKSKQYTSTRIHRALLHILLGITTEEMKKYQSQQFQSYARILGLKKRAFPLLKEMHAHSNIPIIQQSTRVTKEDLPLSFPLFQLDLKAHELYEMLLLQKFHLPYECYERDRGRKPLIL
ncbi:MAG TPA: nucleotidyltransferase [Candidatus Scybalomonas excrementigallinarum]|nr:nucleotidyltransferase [Candidatus Scybalomonas excrementigallinarum]